MKEGATQTSIIAITVVAFEAEKTIQDVLERIPESIAGESPMVLISDDHSSDRTLDAAEAWASSHPDLGVRTARQPANLGYGGNQVAAYRWAAHLGADIVVLLHGDGQYPPEQIEDLVQPILDGSCDAVFGSRMIIPGGARAGGMPMHRFVANRVLTWMLNRMCTTTFTEWFSGFRAYRLGALGEIDIGTLPAGFDADVAICLRFLDRGFKIEEIAIPTHYGDEVSRVPLAATGLNALRHGVVHVRSGRPRQESRSSEQVR